MCMYCNWRIINIICVVYIDWLWTDQWTDSIELYGMIVVVINSELIIPITHNLVEGVINHHQICSTGKIRSFTVFYSGVSALNILLLVNSEYSQQYQIPRY